jgi:hypothetical protein
MSSNDKQDKSDTPRMDATLGKGSDWVFAEGCRLERELAESRQMHAELQREIEKMAANTFRSHAAPVAADPQPLPGTACKAIYDEAIAVAQREKPLGSSADWISTALVHVYAAGQRSITRSATAQRAWSVCPHCGNGRPHWAGVPYCQQPWSGDPAARPHYPGCILRGAESRTKETR